jgi:hypothetical protein
VRNGPCRGVAVLWAALLALLLVACGEEDPDIAVPPRDDGQVLLDEAGILGERVAEALRDIEGWDVVAVAYETPQANAGEAHRAGQVVVDAWDADIVLVAVARPGDFASEDVQARRRFFGATPANVRVVPAGLREELADEVVPPLAAGNEWEAAFEAAAARLAEELQ